MGYRHGFHAPQGAHFLGWRRARNGQAEVVYDDGVSRRMVWRLDGGVDEAALDEALGHAVGALRVVPALMSELKKRAIAVEAVLR
jgi:hypothetical protein